MFSAHRPFHLQLDQADEFRLLAEENRINIRLLPPARGLIFDRNGIPIADNEQNYRVVMVREDAGDVGEVLAKLTEIVDIDPDDLTRAMQEMQRRSPFVPVTIADRLSWEDVAEINLNTPALPGIQAEVGLSRVYPLGADLAHVVGYVGPVSDYDLSRIEDPDPLLQIPKFQIGKVGVERRLEDQLRGVVDLVEMKAIYFRGDNGEIVEEGEILPDDLYGADEAFITSASAFVMPVVEMDGQAIGTGAPGKVTERLREIYLDEMRKILTHPDDFILMHVACFRLTDMGIQVDIASSQPSNTVCFSELEVARVLKRVVTIVRYPRAEMRLGG